MRGKMGIKDYKNAKAVKKEQNRKKRKKNKVKNEDSDLSDFEDEVVEEVPPDVSLKVRKLVRETNQELSEGEVAGADFLEKDPLIDFDFEGFLPESEGVADTREIWAKLGALADSGAREVRRAIYNLQASWAERMEPVYREIGKFLSNYRSGPLPKGFKAIPKMANWAEVLRLTSPRSWSPNAVFRATLLFSSNLNEKNAEVFYECVLLPSVRESLAGSRKLNPHVYESLIKAVFKPKAWLRGILLPLVKEGCTYREASVVGSVLRKVSIPAIYAAASVLEICQLPRWFGSTSFILAILFEKKYKFPLKVIRECVSYFCKFADFHDSLPVIWHQSLYVFLLNYKHLLTGEEIEMLRELTRKHKHPQIGQAVDRLFSCQIAEIKI